MIVTSLDVCWWYWVKMSEVNVEEEALIYNKNTRM